MHNLVISVLLAVLLLASIAVLPVRAQDKPATAVGGKLEVELNTTNQLSDACRIALVVKNGMRQSIESLVIELVLFGKDGKVLRLLSASVGAMPVSKTRLKQYDVQDVKCESIGRVLLNGLTSCEGENLTAKICTAATRTSSRTTTPLDY